MPSDRTRITPALVLAALIAASCGRTSDTVTDVAVFPPDSTTTTTSSPAAGEEPSIDLGAELAAIIDDAGVPALGAAAFDRSGITAAAVSGRRSRSVWVPETLSWLVRRRFGIR
ncbi:MAG: hypothetical protein GY745_24095 [Actinomycetia bacterium]|nr:hypothetical protein [Actinomycetes bacterium]MCP4088097.1 hypothetical protein [Actinomycetes bacterium]